MKTIKITALLAALLMLIPALTSCDNDKDEPGDKNGAAERVTGSYSGTMNATVSAMGNIWENIEMGETYTVKITAQKGASDRVTVSLPECSYTPPMGDALETIPALVIENVKAEDKGNGLYSLEKEEYSTAVNGVQYTVRIYDYDKDDQHAEDGTTISGNDIRLVYSVTPGKMPGFINFTFTGTRN